MIRKIGIFLAGCIAGYIISGYVEGFLEDCEPSAEKIDSTKTGYGVS